MHAADDTPSNNAATRPRHCNFMCQGGATSLCSSRIEEERDNARRGGYSRGTTGRKRCQQH